MPALLGVRGINEIWKPGLSVTLSWNWIRECQPSVLSPYPGCLLGPSGRMEHLRPELQHLETGRNTNDSNNKVRSPGQACGAGLITVPSFWSPVYSLCTPCSANSFWPPYQYSDSNWDLCKHQETKDCGEPSEARSPPKNHVPCHCGVKWILFGGKKCFFQSQ